MALPSGITSLDGVSAQQQEPQNPVDQETYIWHDEDAPQPPQLDDEIPLDSPIYMTSGIVLAITDDDKTAEEQLLIVAEVIGMSPHGRLSHVMSVIEVIATLDWMMADLAHVPAPLLRPPGMHELNAADAHFTAIYDGAQNPLNDMFRVMHFIQYGGFSKIKHNKWHLLGITSILHACSQYNLMTAEIIMAAATHASYENMQFALTHNITDDDVRQATLNAISGGNIDAYRAITETRPLEMSTQSNICIAATAGRMDMTKFLMGTAVAVDVPGVIKAMCSTRAQYIMRADKTNPTGISGDGDITHLLLTRGDATGAMCDCACTSSRGGVLKALMGACPQWRPNGYTVRHTFDSTVLKSLVDRFGLDAWLMQNLQFNIHNNEFIRAAITAGVLDIRAPHIAMMHDPDTLRLVCAHPAARRRLVPRGFLHSMETFTIALESGYRIGMKTLIDASPCRNAQVIERVLNGLKNKTCIALIKLSECSVDAARALVQLIDANDTRLIPAYGSLCNIIGVVSQDLFAKMCILRFNTTTQSGKTPAYEAAFTLKDAIRRDHLECALLIIEHGKINHIDVLRGFVVKSRGRESRTILALAKLYDEALITYCKHVDDQHAAEDHAAEDHAAREDAEVEVLYTIHHGTDEPALKRARS